VNLIWSFIAGGVVVAGVIIVVAYRLVKDFKTPWV
jgi:hypothetical protein